MSMDIIPAADGNDRKQVVNGRAWRVRLREHTRIDASAPVNGEAVVAPAGYGLIISVALLDEEDNVAVNAAGELLIFPAHTLTIQAEQLQREDFDLAAIVENEISERIAVAERSLAGKAQVVDLLAAWLPGGA